MPVHFAKTIADVPDAALCAGEDDVDAQVCAGRLLQLEARRGMQITYAIHEGADGPTGVIPLTESAGSRWVHPWHSPASYGLDHAEPPDVVVAGHPFSVRSVLRVDRTDGDADLRAILDAIADFANGRVVLFPHYGDASSERLREALPASEWRDAGTQSWFDTTSETWEEQLPAQRRRARRDDRVAFTKHALELTMEPWGESASAELAARWISAHSRLHRMPDHPALTTARYNEWTACAEVDVVLFTVRAAGEVVAVTTGLHWSQRLTAFELGLASSDHPARMAAYLLAGCHGPTQYALEHGAQRVYLGYESDAVKRRRGATAEICRFGSWAPAGTRRVT